MNDRRMTIERNAMRFSFIGSAVFVIAECIMFFVTGSRAIMMDFIFDAVDLILIGPFLVLIPLLYKSETERHPYGYGQFEALFIIIKYSALVMLCVFLLVSNVRVMLHGGTNVDAGYIAVFELCVGVVCVLMYAQLKYFSKKYASMIIESELFAWKLYSCTSAGVGAGFLLQHFLGKTGYAYLTPYMDPLIAIILTLILLIEPVKAIISNSRAMLLFAAPDEVMDEVRAVAEEELSRYSCRISFLEVLQTGRKTWVEIYIDGDGDMFSLEHLRLARNNIRDRLNSDFDQLYIELIPYLPD